MICDVMPTIPEDAMSQGDHESIHSVDNTNVEDMLLGMLDERDRLMEALRLSQEQLEFTRTQLNEVHRERDHYQQELENFIPKDLAAASKQIVELKEQLNEKNDEVADLKAERNNTKLLLEHLECLVAKHERSLRMTVIKRQANIPGSVASNLENNFSSNLDFNSACGISSEVEVLKALKSLFDHHKELDEKIRERLKSAQEHVKELEENLEHTEAQLKIEKNKNRSPFDNSDVMMKYDKGTNTEHIVAMPNAKNSIELSNTLEFQQRESERFRKALEEKEECLLESKKKLIDLNNIIAHLDADNNQNQKRIKSQSDQIEKLLVEIQSQQQTHDLLELTKRDLELKYSQTQKDFSNLVEENNRLRKELIVKSTKLIQCEEKNIGLQNLLMNSTNCPNPSSQDNEFQYKSPKHSKSDHLIPVPNTLKQDYQKQMDALKNELLKIKNHYSEAVTDLERAKELEHINDQANQRLVALVDRLMTDSNTRLHKHLDDRMQSLKQKRDLAQELDRVKRLLQETQKSRDQAHEECKQLRKEQIILQETVRNFKEENEVMDPTIAGQFDAFSNGISIENSVQQQFSSPWPVSIKSPPQFLRGILKPEESSHVSLFDPQALAKMIQQQLKSINNEIRLIEEAKQSTDMRSEELQSRAEEIITSPIPNLEPPRPPKICSTSPVEMRKIHTPKINKKLNNDLYHNENNANHFGSTKSSPHSVNVQSSVLWSQPLPMLEIDHFKKSPLVIDTATSSYSTWESPGVFLTSNNDRRLLTQKYFFLDEVSNSTETFQQWTTSRIIQWLEIWLEMPAWYVAACRANIRSGAVLTNLSDQDLQKELGISNPMHKLKLRLGIQEMEVLTSKELTTHDKDAFINTVRIQGGLNHEWIGNQWLPSLGLGQYRPQFMECLVDGRMLTSLTKRDLRTIFRMVENFHRHSLVYGILCLKQLNFDRFELENRREACQLTNTDLVVWSVDRLISWLNSIGLQEWSENLRDSGVHGALLALDMDFDLAALCLVLRISKEDSQTKKLLEDELIPLVRPYKPQINSLDQPFMSMPRSYHD